MAKVAKSTKKFLVKKRKENQKSKGNVGGHNGHNGHNNITKKKRKVDKVENNLVVVEKDENVSHDDDDDDDDDYNETAGFTTEINNNNSSNDDSSSSSSSEEEDDSEDDDSDTDISSNDGAQDDDEEIDMGINMKELKESDPKFYQYLVENDQKLLDFDNVVHNVDDDKSSLPLQQDSVDLGHEQVDEMDMDLDHHDDDDDSMVTREKIHQWRISIAKTFSIKTLKKIVLAFKAAAAFGDEQEIQDSLRYRIEDEKGITLLDKSSAQ